ncbi:hypothetical protein [Methanoregula sp.]|uniref:hypothetical protein n=1 Tax=Methanoregula sp. TaxID=2052170 RepID=UPI000CBFC345|nr:hypothetical protein [Methanoregula sp.]PKG32407.1 MAG: hypothetical protein CW742_08315 [Methanoregula sp.]
MKEPQEIERTYIFRAEDVLIPRTEQDLKAADPQAGLKRKIIATSERTWNGDLFPAEEIKKAVQDAIKHKETEGFTYYPIPLILDHSWQFLDKVGATFDLTFEPEVKIRNKTIKNAMVASVEFWTGTPMLDEVAARVQKDPEGTFFSVRIRGLLNYDQDKDVTYWTNFRVIHIAPVLEPADPDAQMIGELARNQAAERGSRDFSLSANHKNQETMPKDEDFKALEDNVKDLSAKVDKFLSQKEADNAQKAEETAAADLTEKATIMAEIFGLDKDVDRNFVKSLSKDQLLAYKVDLERRVNTGTSEKGKAAGGSGGAPSVEDLAKKLMGV